jgi:hypothetical protein
MAARDWRGGLLAALAVASILAAGAAALRAAGISDVRNTKHNLSVTGAGPVRSTTESQVCVFCHTPHGATPGVTPLWNRALGTTTYTPYTSSSLDAQVIQGGLDQPGGSSKLCLSCHDGTVAIGNVNVLNGVGSAATQGTVSIPMTGTGTGGTMPAGSGATTGFTRNLGTDLANDHPISVSYTNALAVRDGELRVVDANQQHPAGSGSLLGVRGPGYRPQLPLEPTGPGGIGQVQCATCHDPHRRETDLAKGNQKFLRQNRFQEAAPAASHNAATDIICITCHDKNVAGGIWAYSAHANPLVATQTYNAAAAAQREFPAGLPVWRAACLNCHDTHTVPGARRLAREATDSASVPKSGGASAIEENCYQCHTTAVQSAISPTTTVPDVRTDFQLARRMPIRSSDQAAGTEVHDITANFVDAGFVDCSGPTSGCGKDFLEPRAKLGAGISSNRHAECTDCHNPHRVVKFRSFLGNPPGSLAGTPDPSGTHDRSAGATVTNIASGVLRGAWGVEPSYGSASFFSMPTGYEVKRGDPGANTSTASSAPYVTREYQICLKCHSDYGYADNNVYPVGSRPSLGYPGGTPAGTNNLTQYTNQAREFQAPVTHQGQAATTDSGAVATVLAGSVNHRSWHPVIAPTGRDASTRGNGNNISARWLAPFSNAVGAQTIYCSDCHGSGTAAGTIQPAGGENGSPWGPHGSSNNFILKGPWNAATGSGQADALCFKCHDAGAYANDSGARTGFYNDPGDKGRGDLHAYHRNKIGRIRCSWCHVAVPHGWKNKAFLVNLNDVGPEAGLAAGTQVRNNTTATYNNGPYYMNSVLKIRRFAPSGLWREADCGSRGAPGNGQSGRSWMRDSSENCANAP